MVTVTRFVKQTKQPYGGFLPIKSFSKTDFSAIEPLHDISQENVHSSIVGMAVDYLTRYKFTRDFLESFKFSIKGAWHAGCLDDIEALQNVIEGSNWDETVIAACKLVRYDVVYRTGVFVEAKNTDDPNKQTIENITRLIERSCSYLQSRGGVLDAGASLEFSSKEWNVTKGDFDFITEQSLVDLKVSVKPPTSKESFQILIYYILLNQKTEFKDMVNKVKALSLFNPRLNTEWKLDVCDIPQDVMAAVTGLLRR